MKIAFVIYHDILDDRVSKALSELNIDFYTEWENVKGKGHNTDAHLGNRPYPGYNNVRMIAFAVDSMIESLTSKIKELNEVIERDDDKIRMFLVPLEKIV